MKDEGKTNELINANEQLKQEVAERKLAEEALRQTEEKFRSIFEQSPIGIALYDPDGQLLDLNKACLDIFGVSDVAEVQGLDLFDDLDVSDELKERLRKGETVRYEAPFDFEKVKGLKLHETTKSGIIYT